jgi:hypothetical protein
MTRMSRTLLALPVALALMLPAVPALADTTTGYQQSPSTPTTTTSTTTASATSTTSNTTTGYQQTPVKPASGTGPSKETATPTTSTSPAKTATPTSTTTTHVATKSTLPFTGLDLRWIIGAGLLLLAAGISLRISQRRQRHDLGR